MALKRGMMLQHDWELMKAYAKEAQKWLDERPWLLKKQLPNKKQLPKVEPVEWSEVKPKPYISWNEMDKQLELPLKNENDPIAAYDRAMKGMK